MVTGSHIMSSTKSCLQSCTVIRGVYQNYREIQFLLETGLTFEEEKPNNGGPPSPLMLQLMEIGFSRTSVEMAFKTLGIILLLLFLNSF